MAKATSLRLSEDEHRRLSDIIGALTPREREVLAGIVTGRLNKQIAGDLGIAEKTIKYHRGNLMRKMKVRTVADLVRVAERAGIGKAPAA